MAAAASGRKATVPLSPGKSWRSRASMKSAIAMSRAPQRCWFAARDFRSATGANRKSDTNCCRLSLTFQRTRILPCLRTTQLIFRQVQLDSSPDNWAPLMATATARSYKPGEQIPASGIYKVIHRTHRHAHENIFAAGQTFPPCKHCGDKVRFQAVNSSKLEARAQ